MSNKINLRLSLRSGAEGFNPTRKREEYWRSIRIKWQNGKLSSCLPAFGTSLFAYMVNAYSNMGGLDYVK